MTTITLGQDWISRLTSADLLHPSTVGGALNSLPSTEDLKAALRDIAASQPVREIVRRKWFGIASLENVGDSLFDSLFSHRANTLAPAMFRGRRSRDGRGFNEEIATMAWIAHVGGTAKEQRLTTRFRATAISHDFVSHLTKLSAHDDGPIRAVSALRSVGVHVVIERALPSMCLDGASFHTGDIGAVVALTLRHDRLDNFWFTLLHEVGHIALHLPQPNDDVFVDTVEDVEGDAQEVEAEANAFAKDALIPRDTWLRSEAFRFGSEKSVLELANTLGIHPSIVAGRIRYERRDFKIFNQLIGIDHVRSHFVGG